MKTNYFLITMLLLLSMTSCSTYYRMTSRVERDGSMYREIYAQGDSAFIAGDKTHNPFLFQPNANWQLVNLDSTIKFNFLTTCDILSYRLFIKNIQHSVSCCKCVLQCTSKIIKCNNRSERTHHCNYRY